LETQSDKSSYLGAV